MRNSSFHSFILTPSYTRSYNNICMNTYNPWDEWAVAAVAFPLDYCHSSNHHDIFAAHGHHILSWHNSTTGGITFILHTCGEVHPYRSCLSNTVHVFPLFFLFLRCVKQRKLVFITQLSYPHVLYKYLSSLSIVNTIMTPDTFLAAAKNKSQQDLMSPSPSGGIGPGQVNHALSLTLSLFCLR